MRRKQARIDPAEAHSARLAWWAAFITTAILALGLGFIRNAEAATPPAGALAPTPLLAPLAIEEEEEEEEEEEFELEEACELEEEGEEFGFEECESEIEGEEFELEEENRTPPAECRLESADAAVFADLAHRKLRLALRYTARRSTPVVIKSWLRGRRGPLTLKKQRRRVGRAGVLHTVQKLTPRQARKVAAAKAFTIQVRPAGAPRYCGGYLDQRLTIRRGGKHHPTWIDSNSTFRH